MQQSSIRLALADSWKSKLQEQDKVGLTFSSGGEVGLPDGLNHAGGCGSHGLCTSACATILHATPHSDLTCCVAVYVFARATNPTV